jgi:hypothetical protein
MRVLLVVLLSLLPALARSQTCATVAECQTIIFGQFSPQWTNGGNSGFRQAMRDSCKSVSFVYAGSHHCAQIVYRDEEHELPSITLGEAWPTGAAFPNRDDAPDHRGQSTVKRVFLSTNPLTGQPYVDASGLFRGIRLVASETGNERDYARGVGEDLAYLLTLCFDVEGTLRCRRQGEARQPDGSWAAHPENSGWYTPEE